MKYIKYTLVVFLCAFSFYFSDKLILYVESLSPLMKSIKEQSPKLKELPANAIISGNTIIPGKNGKVVNERESYLKMNDFGTFNETFFVFDYIEPEISLKNNLDKIIIAGNNKTSVSLIVDNQEFSSYLLTQNINFAKIITNEEENVYNNIDYINGNSNKSQYENLNIFLKRKKINKKLCLVGYSNMEYCKKNSYYLISPSIEFYHSNIATYLNKIEGSNIILIHNSVTLNEGKLILKKIKEKNLEIVSLSEIITE